MQEDIRNTKLRMSVAAPRQVHLRGRDQHQHGVGDPYGGSQIGKQKDRGRRWRVTSALQDGEISLPVPKGGHGKE